MKHIFVNTQDFGESPRVNDILVSCKYTTRKPWQHVL